MLSLTATLIALPAANSQLDAMPIMNLPGDEGTDHYAVLNVQGYDIDLNGPSGSIPNMTLWVKYPGRTDFTFIHGVAVAGDLDVYTGITPVSTGGTFNFNETGTWELMWRAMPAPPTIPVNPSTPDGSYWSNIEIAKVVATALLLPPSYAETLQFVTAQPIGAIGQQMFIIFWTSAMPPDIGETTGAVSSPSGRAGWYDITLHITDPDEEEITYVNPYTDPVGGGYFMFTPTKTGNYSVYAEFPGAWKNSSSGNLYYPPIDSDVDYFTVRDEPLREFPEAPLPSDYWQRPISGGSHAWAEINGNWMGSYANQYPVGASGGTTSPYGYGSAPGSPHILWTRQHYPSGGLMDERLGTEAYTLNHYQDVDFDGTDLILDGVIHYTPQYTGHWGAGIAAGSFGWGGISLYTGELLFEDPWAIKPDFGQIFLYNSPNQHGGFSYLWRRGVELPATVEADPQSGPNQTFTLTSRGGTQNWECIDAWTLNRVCWIANVTTSGEMVYSKIGAICFYSTTSSGGNYYLRIWNSSEALSMYAQDEGTGRWQWRPQWGGHSNYQYRWRENVDAFHDGMDCFMPLAPIPSLRGPINARQNQTASIRAVREGEYVIFGTPGANDGDGIAPAWFFAVSLEPGNIGQKLWETTFTPPQAQVLGGGFTQGMSLAAVVPEDEVIIYENSRVQKLWAYDLKTGEKLWESDPGPQLWYYGMNQDFYDGMIIAHATYGGEVIAYDSRTGEIRWHYKADPEGANSPYGRPLFAGPIIADGKMYGGTSEHSASTPLWRSEGLKCIDIETGELLWHIMWWGSDFAVADGILVSFNWFDGQVYGFGKGPSATTVTASPDVSMHGTDVMIKGTVTDQTPTYARNIQNEKAFTLKDTPAISDEWMDEWMEYKYMEQGYPADATGVNVTLTVIDPNSNIYEIGTVTSDITGAYGQAFEPLVPGTYQIIAAFEGSESYYGSSAITYFTVEEAPAATAEPTPPPASMTDTYVLGLGIGAIIAIIAVRLLLFLMLRKR